MNIHLKSWKRNPVPNEQEIGDKKKVTEKLESWAKKERNVRIIIKCILNQRWVANLLRSP
jgi:hypothetical protein